MSTLRVVLGDQLSFDLASLKDAALGDTVLMMEVIAECTYVRHHAKKIVLILSAMRHFAQELRARGLTVCYVTLDDPANTQSFSTEILRAAAALRPERIIATEPGEWRVLDAMRHWQAETGIETDILPDDRFLCRIQAFRAWAAGKKQLRMEFFYRDMRRQTGLLMDGTSPVGGLWNYDAENRKRLPKGAALPDVAGFVPDAVTHDVMALVAEKFGGHFGAVDGFSLPVTHSDAEAALDDFVAMRLPSFGDWQDAMVAGEPFLFHAHISTSLNCGLLNAAKICERVQAAYDAGRVPLNAAEGFIRQIIGWREFVRGIYWLHMPDYAQRNGLSAARALPQFYWDGETDMRCMREAITQTRDNAYAHHIQRLMVTGNFALLCGFAPDDVDEWYLIVYADAYEWVEMPNVRGMALHADNGVVGSKPYAASGAYINRMSDYCGGCRYQVADAVGEEACPFNALYWDFMARHRERFASNPRMAMPIRTMDRMAPARIAAMRARAADLLGRMERGERV